MSLLAIWRPKGGAAHLSEDSRKTLCGLAVTAKWTQEGTVSWHDPWLAVCGRCVNRRSILQRERMQSDPLHGQIGRGNRSSDRRYKGNRPQYSKVKAKPGDRKKQAREARKRWEERNL